MNFYIYTYFPFIYKHVVISELNSRFYLYLRLDFLQVKYSLYLPRRNNTPDMTLQYFPRAITPSLHMEHMGYGQP